MLEFSTEDGTGSYDAGLLALPGGERRGIEEVARLTVRTQAAPALPGLLGTLRGTLPSHERLAMPLRLAVSTVRAGLGAIEEGLTPGGGVAVEIAFTGGDTLVARMSRELAATMERDRAMVLAALARVASSIVPADVHVPIPAAAAERDEAAEALTSIFRYEKRNGRLRRVGGSDKTE